jgi:hypothetical protein
MLGSVFFSPVVPKNPLFKLKAFTYHQQPKLLFAKFCQILPTQIQIFHHKDLFILWNNSHIYTFFGFE